MRKLRQVGDAHGLVTALGDQLDERAAQPLALVGLDLLARHAVRPGGQAAVAVARAVALRKAVAETERGEVVIRRVVEIHAELAAEFQ